MNHNLDALIEAIGRACDQDIARYDDAFLAQSLQKRLAACGGCTVAAYLARLAADPAEAAAFVRSLNITYSEFFRNPQVFALLEGLILPSLAQEKARAGGQEIRVWSAGCARGQEAYSVAILLDELAVPCRIFASDIAADELTAAQKGIYTAAALQNVRLRHLHNYFVQQGESYRIIPRLRDRVDFSLYDLLDRDSTCPAASIYGDFDLIFCSNLLFYYRPELRGFILDKATRCLAPNGYLVTGEAERDSVTRRANLVAVAPAAAVFRRCQRGR